MDHNAAPTSGQPAEHVPIELEQFHGIDLRALRPPELVSLFQELLEEDASLDERERPTEEHTRLYHALTDGGLESIPEKDADYGRALANEFASSPNKGARWSAISMLPSLTRAEHDSGLELWQRLIRDVDEGNRDAALELTHVHLLVPDGSSAEMKSLLHLDTYFQGSPFLAEQGLTPEDAYRLHDIYLSASSSDDLYDPTEDLIGRLKDDA